MEQAASRGQRDNGRSPGGCETEQAESDQEQAEIVSSRLDKVFALGRLQGAQRVEYVQRLGQTLGNRAVTRFIQRQRASAGAVKLAPEVQRTGSPPVAPVARPPVPTGRVLGGLSPAAPQHTDTPGLSPNQPEIAADSFNGALQEAETFHGHAPFGPRDVTPGSPGTGHGPPGNAGGFEVTYNPQEGVLRVVMRVAVRFADALTVQGNNVIPADRRLQALADTAMRQPAGPARTAFLARYRWQATEHQPWIDQMVATVHTAWSNQHQFHINRRAWEWIGARVEVQIQAFDRPKTPNDHLSMRVIKTPSRENLYTRHTASDGTPGHGTTEAGQGNPTNPRDQTMLLASTDITARPDNSLFQSVSFAPRSVEISDQSIEFLRRFIATFEGRPGNPRSNPAHVLVRAHEPSAALSSGGSLGETRARRIAHFLETNGLSHASERLTQEVVYDNQGDRVDLIVDHGQAQVLVNHEFGHLFGLADEYATDHAGLIDGTGQAAGTEANHDALFQGMQASSELIPGSTGAITENNENIMSLGNVIRPQHYVTFWRALQIVTGVDEWAYGPPQSRPERHRPQVQHRTNPNQAGLPDHS